METKDHPLAFIADETVGRLAKWLRILGFDVCYDPELPRRVPDSETRAKRIYLTRSRCHYKNLPGVRILRLASDDAMQQLTEVIKALDLSVDGIAPCSRCIRCNVATTAIAKDAASGKVPDYIWQTQARFYRCDRCGRIYWPGSHYKRIRTTIANLLRAKGA